MRPCLTGPRNVTANAPVWDGDLTVRAATYSLTLLKDRPFVQVYDASGEPLVELFALSGVQPLNGGDDTTTTDSWRVEEHPREVVITMEARSSAWAGKTYRFRCHAERFTYEIDVEGHGQVREVDYFGGYYSGRLRWGSGFFESGQRFRQGFNPEPSAEESNSFSPRGGSVIDITGGPLPGRRDWFFSPPPFCFAFEGENGWVGIGMEAQPGEHLYTEYRYRGHAGFHLSLSYEGYMTVQGRRSLPAIGFDFGADRYQVLDAHARAVRTAGKVDPMLSEAKPPWWYEPIFCGWGAQCHLSAVEQGYRPQAPGHPSHHEFIRTLARAASYSRQPLYEQFLLTLDHHGLRPGIVVLDDKWQAAYGLNQADTTKWPDLRGFITERHAVETKVLLWLKAWDPEGLPAEECITNAAGLPVSVDPTNPAFERRLRESVQTMLSSEGYGADGFKVDFTQRIPTGPGMHRYGSAWGVELMKLYLGIIYGEAKRAKPDALVMTQTPHPYLADVLDMVRLNDMLDLSLMPDPDVAENLVAEMARRARVARIACPGAVIDTDNWPVWNKAVWREYVRHQPQLGVPSLYFTTHIDSSQEPLDPHDYQLVRESWERHRSAVQAGKERPR